MARETYPPEKIRKFLIEDTSDTSNDEGDDYISSSDDGECDEITSAPAFSSYEKILQFEQDLCGSCLSTWKSRNSSEIWSTVPTKSSKGRNKAHNVLRERKGLTSYAKRNIGNIASAFTLFFRDSLLEKICKWTNKEGYQKMNDDWKPLNSDELKNFI